MKKNFTLTMIALLLSFASFALGTISGTKTVCVGNTTGLADTSTGGTWHSGNTAVATVTSIGVVTGVSAGTATISYSRGTALATTVVTVNPTPATISGPTSVCAGGTITLSDATSGGTWTSATSSVATITSGGVLTGVSSGVTGIYYLVGGCAAFHSVTVIAGPSSIGGTKTICAGSTTTLTDATSGGAWSSANTSVATIGITSGVVTGVSAGTAIISYVTSSGCSAYTTVTVTGAATIYGPTTVCVGLTITLSDATSGGTWTTSSTSTATVSSGGVVTGVGSGAVNIYYIVGSCYGYHTVTVTSGATSIGGTKTTCVGSTTALTDATSGGAWTSSNTAVATIGMTSGVVTGISAGTATITYMLSSGCTAYTTITITTGAASITGPSTVCAGSAISDTDATTGGTWSSSNTAVATVNAYGTITGVSAGTATIYYIAGGCYAYKTVTVTAGATIYGSSSVCVGLTITLTDATTGGSWTSSNTAVATISSGGLVTGVSAGTANIYYFVSGCYAYHTVTVTSGAASISGTKTTCIGSTTALTDATSGGAWTSSNTAVATVGITSGIVTGVSAGTTTISYVLSGGCLAYTTVTITTSASSITGPSTVCAGSAISDTDATTGGTWSSSNSAVATVTSYGYITGVSAGTATIYYVIGSCYAYKTVTVTAGATIYGPSTVCVGLTITLTDATTGGTWTSSNTALATVSSGGVVTGVGSGTVNIYYSVGGCFAYHTVTVTSGASSIGGTKTTCIGSTTTLTDATSGGSWTSSNTSVATVGITSGVVTGVAAGTATISYILSSGCAAYTTVTITSGAASITGPSTVCAGSAISDTDATTGGTWSSSNTAIATVTSSGTITGVAAGTATIYYIAGGCYAFKTVTVTGGASISGSTSVCVGLTITLSDAISGGTWSSGNTAVATVSSGGVVTGISIGTTNITYSVSGCISVHTVSVTSGAASIGGTTTVCIGSTTTLTDATTGGSWTSGNTSVATIGITSGVVTGMSAGTATITYKLSGGCSAVTTVTVTSGTTIYGPSTVCAGSSITLSDATSGGTWLTSSTATATVTSGGTVTGVAAGVVNIYYTVGGCYGYHTVTVTGGVISGASTVCAGSTISLSDATTGGTWLSSDTTHASVSSTGVVTGVSAGTATIYYIAGGCYAYHTVTVTGGASISGPSTVCAGSTITLSDATSGGTWISSNTATATVSSGGTVTGVAAGVVNIYYSVGGCYAYHTVTVTGGVISGASTVCAGSTIALSDATSGGTWLSSDTTHAKVSSSGVVTGVSAGTATIYYIVGGCYAYHTVTVTGGASISGPSAVCVGSTITLSDATSGGTWISSNTAIATVTSGGTVTGVAAGVVNIYYSVGGCYAYHTVTVTGGTSISGPSTVCVGNSITLSDATSGGTWLSSDTAHAKVNSSGVVTGIGAGTATIYYIVGGCYAYHVVTVTPVPTTISGFSIVAIGGTITLSDGVSGGTWLSSNTSIGTISSGGTVTGVSAGVINIYYLLGGCGAYHTVTVTTGTPGSISGSIVSGAAKGTSGASPVVGIVVNLEDGANNLITTTNTDNSGNYNFMSLADGNYVIYPVDADFSTISAPVVIGGSNQVINNIDFVENVGSKIISPVTTSVTQVVSKGDISIFPNPTTGNLNIKWNGQPDGNASVVISDVVGRQVYNSDIKMASPSGQVQINLSDLKNAVYLITIKSDNIYYSSKLLIQQ